MASAFIGRSDRFAGHVQSSDRDVAGEVAEVELRLFKVGDPTIIQKQAAHRDVVDGMLLVVARKG